MFTLFFVGIFASGVMAFPSLTGSTGIGAPQTKLSYIRFENSHQNLLATRGSGFSRDHIDSLEFIYGYVTEDVLEDLSNRGIKLEQIDEQSTLIHPNRLGSSLGLFDEPHDLTEGYLDYQELLVEMQEIALHPDVHLETAGVSVEGRELWYLRLANPGGSADLNRANVLLIANMHGNETAGRRVLMNLARLLVEQPSYENLQIFLMPSMNPDGFAAGTRANANGVDLNRDFPDFTSPDVHTRQPETKAIIDLHERYSFISALNFHGGAVCFNMPWDVIPNRNSATRFADDRVMNLIARRYADANETMAAGRFDRGVTYGYEWYPATGTMQDWASHDALSMHATVELSYDKWPPAFDLENIWEENRSSLLEFLAASSWGIDIEVVDEAGTRLSEAQLRHSASTRSYKTEDGTFMIPTIEEGLVVEISADGYEKRELTWTPGPFGIRTAVTLSQ